MNTELNTDEQNAVVSQVDKQKSTGIKPYKFTLNSKELAKALSAHKGVISKNPVVPILENYHLTIQSGRELVITSSNLNVTLSTKLQVQADEHIGGKTKAIISALGRLFQLTIPAEKLNALLSVLPDQPLIFEHHLDTFATVISTSTGKYKLAGENPADFPMPKPFGEGKEGTFPVDSLATAIAHTRPYVSTDGLRPAMCGVYFEPTPGGVNLVTTDGHRLAVCLAQGAKIESEFILPADAVSVLRSLLATDAEVQVLVENNRLRCSGNNWQLFAQLVDAQFPAYQNAAPTDNHISAIVDRKDFISLLKRVMVLSNSVYQIEVNISEDEISVKSEDLDYGQEATDTLACTTRGGDLKIGFNARYLIEILTNMTANELTILASQPNRGAIINESPESWALIMPVALRNQ